MRCGGRGDTIPALPLIGRSDDLDAETLDVTSRHFEDASVPDTAQKFCSKPSVETARKPRNSVAILVSAKIAARWANYHRINRLPRSTFSRSFFLLTTKRSQDHIGAAIGGAAGSEESLCPTMSNGMSGAASWGFGLAAPSFSTALLTTSH